MTHSKRHPRNRPSQHAASLGIGISNSCLHRVSVLGLILAGCTVANYANAQGFTPVGPRYPGETIISERVISPQSEKLPAPKPKSPPPLSVADEEPMSLSDGVFRAERGDDEQTPVFALGNQVWLRMLELERENAELAATLEYERKLANYFEHSQNIQQEQNARITDLQQQIKMLKQQHNQTAANAKKQVEELTFRNEQYANQINELRKKIASAESASVASLNASQTQSPPPIALKDAASSQKQAKPAPANKPAENEKPTANDSAANDPAANDPAASKTAAKNAAPAADKNEDTAKTSGDATSNDKMSTPDIQEAEATELPAPAAKRKPTGPKRDKASDKKPVSEKPTRNKAPRERGSFEKDAPEKDAPEKGGPEKSPHGKEPRKRGPSNKKPRPPRHRDAQIQSDKESAVAVADSGNQRSFTLAVIPVGFVMPEPTEAKSQGLESGPLGPLGQAAQ
ncbi:hypothetical protein SAMN06265222_11397 [Neorhodopirellula lusitana]|uniref:Secreted protein n=1 Tax=Neorhodopirellula lusitana TaxID=445327 RepID=A0ABY1QH87_9BACT|nr:hypothetical protein [Neorhodopirellula lusitana]SMP70647.1 hypothetical protein SAMN06265222_11397 [Neorhodopirellula lusitana]